SSASVLGPFQVNGQITAGSGNNVITTGAGLLDATKLTNTVPSGSISGTYSNNLTLSGTDTLGSAGNSITVSSNLVVSGALVANSSAGVSGQFLASQGPGTTPVWSSTLPSGSGNYIQNTNSLQAGATAYPAYLYAGSSASVLGPFQVTGQITAGT